MTYQSFDDWMNEIENFSLRKERCSKSEYEWAKTAWDIQQKEIERLKKKCDDQAMFLRRLTPENFPDTLFIHAELGERDQNNMPEKLLVVPAYGCDFSYVYERKDKTVGGEW